MSDSYSNLPARPASVERSKVYLIVALVLGLGGLLVSFYALNHHFKAQSGSTNAACNLSNTLNCDTVAQSIYSTVFSIPVAYWGVVFFAMVLTLAGLGLGKRGEKSVGESIAGLTVLTFAGVAVSIWLIGVSALAIQVLCPTCIVVYLICAGLLINWLALRKYLPPFQLKAAGNGTLSAVVVAAIAIMVYSQFLAPPDTLKPDPQTVDFLDSKVHDIKIDRSAYSGLGEDYRKGAEKPEITIVEFADFQCGACAFMSSLLHSVIQKYSNDVQLVFKNYPLDPSCNRSMQGGGHPHSCLIARMARCAGKFGKFWPFHDLAFEEQSAGSPAKVREWATKIGLDAGAIDECLTNESLVDKLRDDVELGGKLDINGTPTIFMNGRRYIGPNDAQSIQAQIEKLLGK